MANILYFLFDNVDIGISWKWCAVGNELERVCVYFAQCIRVVTMWTSVVLLTWVDIPPLNAVLFPLLFGMTMSE